MLKQKFSKFKRIYTITYLPRIFRNSKSVKNKAYNNRTLQFSTARKTNDTCTETSEVVKYFTTNAQLNDYSPIKEDLLNGNIISPEFYHTTVNRCAKCEEIIAKLFGSDKIKEQNVGNKAIDELKDGNVRATTAKIEEEKLAQKIEAIEETSHVEAHPPKIEGFNSIPKVLGQEIANYKISKENEVISNVFDNLAKRCLDSRCSVGEIDKVLLNELKNISQSEPLHKHNVNVDINKCSDMCCNEFSEYSPEQNISTKLETSYDGNVSYCGNYSSDIIQPLHSNTLPMFTIEDCTKDFKESGFIKSSAFYSAIRYEDPFLDSLSQISPYDKQALPFYEYINKESLDVDEAEAIVIDTIPETEINNPIAEETLRKEGVDQQEPEKVGLEDLKQEDESLNPRPTFTNFTEPLIKSNSNKDSNTYENLNQDYISNILNTYRLLTSTQDHSSGAYWWHPEGINQRSDIHENTAISGTYSNRNISPGNDGPSNTAISANQNPGEYYNDQIKFSPLNLNHMPQLHGDSSVSQSLVFSTMQPRLDLEIKKSREHENMHNAAEINTMQPNLDSEKAKETENMKDFADIKVFKQAAGKTHVGGLVADKESLNSESNVPLSLLLKRIQQRSQLEYCQNVLQKAEAEAVVKPCPPCAPAKQNTNPCKTKTIKSGSCNPCKTKTDSCNPCQTKEKHKTDPCNPCQSPKKKDPCAKLMPFMLDILMKSNGLLDKKKPLTYYMGRASTLNIITEEIVERLTRLGRTLKLIDLQANILENYDQEVVFRFARDFEPWIPIPSWPIPKIEKKRPLVCPKYGCKLPAPRKTSKGKCIPKKNFSVPQVFSI